MTTKLWEASKNQKNNSNLFRYENFLNQKYKIRFIFLIFCGFPKFCHHFIYKLYIDFI